MGVRIDALPSTIIPAKSHQVAAMKDGLTVKLTVDQILGLLEKPDIIDLFNAGDISFTPTGAIAANNVQAALAELDTEKLGLTGGTVTGPTNISRLMGSAVKGTLIGSKIANNAADITNDIDFSAQIVASDAAIPRVFNVAAMTKQLDALWAAGSNAGMRDTGAIADGDWHLFAILNPTNYASDYLASLSPTAPTLPAGFTEFRRIATIQRTTGFIKGFFQYEDLFRYTTAVNDRNSTAALNPGLTTPTQWGVPSGIKVRPVFYFQYECNGPATRVNIQCSSFDRGTAVDLIMVQRSGADLACITSIYDLAETNTARQLYMAVIISTGTIGAGIINTVGYWDSRGR